MGKVRFFNSIRMKIILIFMVLIFSAMQIINFYFIKKLEDQLTGGFKKSVSERTVLLGHTIEDELLKQRKPSDPSLKYNLNQVLNEFTTGDVAEAYISDEKGEILAFTIAKEKEKVPVKTVTSNINDAISEKKTQEDFFVNPKTKKRSRVVVYPIMKNHQVIGCLLVDIKAEKIYQQIDEISDIMKNGTLIAMLITVPIGLILAQMITRPITEMRKHVVEMAKGNFEKKAKIYGNDEIGQLGATFNNLSRKLSDAQSTTDAEKRKLSSILSNMSDGVIATDKRGKVILINDPALKMLELKNEEAMSRPLTKVLEIEDEIEFSALLDTTESMILDYSENERKYYLRAHFSAIQREGTGFANGLITVLHDITEQEKIEEERKEFVANVSHELRTPLTTMRTYLEALADGAIHNEKLLDKFLYVVRDETERMIRLVSDLLNLSKLDNGTQQLRLHWIEFGRYFNKVIDRFEMQKERNISFSREIPDIPVYVEIDPDKINQVIDNIISNALKYSPDGGTISFKLQILDEQIELSIRDQGMGMPKGNVEKIFQRFYRVDKARSRKMGGTGLGLAIAKEIITAHNGDIFARSIEGVGTTIIFSLPYDKEHEDEWE